MLMAINRINGKRSAHPDRKVMPNSAPKTCSKPGCYALATERSRCADHQRKQKHGWSNEYDKARPSRHERGYTSKWVRASKNYLRAHPLCAECKLRGRRTPATLVDHIEPHRGDPVKFWDINNWQGLCVPCHAIKTGRGL